MNLRAKLQTWTNRRLMKNLVQSEQRVLTSLEMYGIFLDPVPSLVIDEQKGLRNLSFAERKLFDVEAYSPNTYTNGLYSRVDGSLYADRDFLFWAKKKRIDEVVAHEYGHRLFSLSMDRYWQYVERKNQRKTATPLFLTGELDQRTPLERYAAYLKTLSQQRRTPLERARLDFDTIVDEMFAQSIALFLVGKTDESCLTDFIYPYRGVLAGDQHFLPKLEETLQDVFFDRMFTVGLKQVIVEIPFVYHALRMDFERYHRPLLADSLSVKV